MDIFLNCIIIILARICDVSLGTLRTVAIVHGRRGLALTFGFFEVLVWAMVVSRIIGTLQDPVYAIAYAAGFAAGNYVGLLIESRIGWGEQIARIFTREGDLEKKLRDAGYRVTTFEGRGLEGPVLELFIQETRRNIPLLLEKARQFDPSCFFLVGNVSYTSRSDM